MFKKKKKKQSSLSKLRKIVRPNEQAEFSDSKTVNKQENDIAEMIDGRAVGTKGSRQKGMKRSDAQSARYEAECKQTSKKSISIKVDWLLDICRLAIGNKKIPLVAIRFLQTHADVDPDWVLIPSYEFKRLLENADNQGVEDWYH